MPNFNYNVFGINAISVNKETKNKVTDYVNWFKFVLFCLGDLVLINFLEGKVNDGIRIVLFFYLPFAYIIGLKIFAVLFTGVLALWVIIIPFVIVVLLLMGIPYSVEIAITLLLILGIMFFVKLYEPNKLNEEEKNNENILTKKLK